MTSTAQNRAYDVAVIGAGHNALVAAAYLAKGGLRTLVLERRERVGGAADTSELAPGIRVPTLAHTVGRLRPSVQRDLALSRHGLSLIAPEVRAFSRPFTNAIIVGMPRIPKRPAISGASSVLSFAMRTSDASRSAAWPYAGAIIRHGPHQGAQKSTTTGKSFDATCRSKFAL